MDLLAQLNGALAGRYIIERQIGQGGMATVFLARDVRHERRVALKVLSPELGAVVGTDRFLAEIRVTANLQHPHLLPLFDSGEAAGQLFYVMPYVEGESLRERLTREKQLPVEEALRIATAVGGALHYAHRHGVIHRDLKPENILLQDGQPLVADFGIALAVSVAGGARVTQTGISLGTPHYMSPEQATGDRAIDSRTDIYSLGAVLYELLTGEPPHTGSTAQAIIARVLTDRPRPMRLTRETVPPHVEAAVECALAKLPADRFATAQEFVDALRGTRPVAASGRATDAAVRPARTRRQLAALALPWILFAATAAALLILALDRPPPPRPARLVLDVGDSVRVRTPGVPRAIAISQDGQRIAFSGNSPQGTGVFVRELAGIDARMIRGSNDGWMPTFSPDGQSLLIGAGGTLRRLDLTGGSSIVSDLGPTAWSWGDDDVVLLYVGGTPSALYLTSSNGGTPRRVAAATQPYIAFGTPHLLPGSRAALLTLYRGSVNSADASVGAVRLENGELVDLGIAGFSPRYVDGLLFFVRQDGVLMGAEFDARRLRVRGTPVPLVDEVLVRQGSGAADYDVSQSGTLVYRTGVSVREIVAVDLKGQIVSVLPAQREFYFPRFSPDGRRIAVGIVEPGRRPDTWIYDRQSRALTRLTFSGADRPAWTPDGRSVVAFTPDSAGGSFFARHSIDGGGAPSVYVRVPGKAVPEIALPRSGRGFFAARVGGPVRDIWIAPVDSPTALRPFVATAAEELTPSVSPDGRWLAYVSNESGRQEVYVRPMPGPGGRFQVSAAGGTEPMWSPRGNGELFYRGAGKIVRARITLGDNPDVVREDLFDDVYQPAELHQNYDVSPDGSTLLFTRSAGPELKFVIVLNWLTEVRERLAAARR